MNRVLVVGFMLRATMRGIWRRTTLESFRTPDGGYGKAATIISLFYALGLIAVPFLPETKGKPLPEADTLSPALGGERR